MAQVVDELIVTLNLDAERYQNAERKVERETDRTYRKQQDRVRRTDRATRDQMRGLKTLGAGIRTVTLGAGAAVAAVAGIGTAVTGILGSFVNFQTNLSRQSVSTGFSNRQMQAWSATARRMGADAEAGAAAVAALAKEQKQFNLTGNGPTMQALATFGVNVSPGRRIEDIIADAQGVYRNAGNGQRMQIESALAARGVSDDLILMIKSEIDVREAYTRSFGQAVDENRESLNKLRDTFESAKATVVSTAATLLETLTPAIEWGAEKLGDFATDLAKFANDLTDAGNSVGGFQKALDDNSPKLGHLFEGFGLLGDVLAGIWPMMQNFGEWLGKLGGGLRERVNRIRNPFGSDGLADAMDAQSQRTHQWLFGRDGENGAANRAVLAFDDWLRRASSRPGNTHATNPALPRNIENDVPRPRTGAAVSASAQSIMQTLTSEYGLTVPQAAAVVANLERESSLNPTAYNPAGGGRGARGLAQWRGARISTFESRYGKLPDQASVAEQLQFMMTDPYERGLLMRSINSGDAQAMGTRMSRIYEAHGDTREDARRGVRATQLANSFGGAGTSINVQNLTVQANNPAEFAQGMQRIDSTQPYNTVVR